MGYPVVDGSDEGGPEHTADDQTHVRDEIAHRDLVMMRGWEGWRLKGVRGEKRLIRG